jgi:hypothetical protein
MSLDILSAYQKIEKKTGVGYGKTTNRRHHSKVVQTHRGARKENGKWKRSCACEAGREAPIYDFH